MAYGCYLMVSLRSLFVSNRDFNLNARSKSNSGNLFHDIRFRMQINNTLVYAHLKPVPRVRTLTTWGLSSSDSKFLSRHAYWTSNSQLSIDGSSLQFGAYLYCNDKLSTAMRRQNIVLPFSRFSTLREVSVIRMRCSEGKYEEDGQIMIWHKSFTWIKYLSVLLHPLVSLLFQLCRARQTFFGRGAYAVTWKQIIQVNWHGSMYSLNN